MQQGVVCFSATAALRLVMGLSSATWGSDMDDGEPRFLNVRLVYDIWQFLRAAVGLRTRHVLALDSMARHLAEVGLVLYAGTIVRDRDNRIATCTSHCSSLCCFACNFSRELGLV